MALSVWLSELRYAWRALRRTPGFLATAIAMLGLALGVGAGIFGVVNAVLLKPLPFFEPDRLVLISSSAPGSDYPERFAVSREMYVHFGEQAKHLEALGTINAFTNTVRFGARTERLRMSAPTSSVFATLGAAPILGRWPTTAESDSVVVISETLWDSWFARDPNVIGKSLEFVNGVNRTIVGVMDASFRVPDNDTLLWIGGKIELADLAEPGRFGATFLIGRLAKGATPESLAAELTTLGHALPQRFGGTPAYARLMSQYRAVVEPLSKAYTRDVAQPLWILLSAALLVFLIACANVANLFLVRTEHRQREMAVRSALGAARASLLRLLMWESAIVAVCTAAVALALAHLALPALLNAAPAELPRLNVARIDGATWGFIVGLSILAALICGLYPALRGSSTSLHRLRESGRGLLGERNGLRQALVAGQTALALVLLIGAGLLLRSLYTLAHVDPGYDPRGVFTFQIAPERASLRDATSYARFDLEFLARLQRLPGVTSAGIVENVPINEGTISMRMRTATSTAEVGEGVPMNFTYTAGDYFTTMAIRVLAGRAFAESDHLTTLGNVIVSRSAAELLWPGRDPIGQRLQREGQTAWETVVGVVEDVYQEGITQGPQAVVYFPLLGPDPASSVPINSPAYVVKTSRMDTIANDIRALVREVAPEAPMYREYTMEGLVRESMVQVTFLLMMLAIAASMALILGSVGLYGVLSYMVAQRTQEIGLRMALGARAAQVRQMVVAQGARMVGLGIVLGLIAALATTRVLASLLFGVATLDAPTFVGMAFVLLAVGLLASYLPARRAARVAPMESLRRE